MSTPKLTEAQRTELVAIAGQLGVLLGDTWADRDVEDDGTFGTRVQFDTQWNSVCIDVRTAARLLRVLRSADITDAGRAALRGES